MPASLRLASSTPNSALRCCTTRCRSTWVRSPTRCISKRSEVHVRLPRSFPRQLSFLAVLARSHGAEEFCGPLHAGLRCDGEQDVERVPYGTTGCLKKCERLNLFRAIR